MPEDVEVSLQTLSFQRKCNICGDGYSQGVLTQLRGKESSLSHTKEYIKQAKVIWQGNFFFAKQMGQDPNQLSKHTGQNGLCLLSLIEVVTVSHSIHGSVTP